MMIPELFNTDGEKKETIVSDVHVTQLKLAAERCNESLTWAAVL